MGRIRGRGERKATRGLLQWGAWLSLGAVWACSPAMPPENATPRGRFDWSLERYEAGKYHDAIRGFRDHLIREPLHPTADSSRFLLADSYLQTDQELLAFYQERKEDFRQPPRVRVRLPRHLLRW